jgi:hypothetical protein
VTYSLIRYAARPRFSQVVGDDKELLCMLLWFGMEELEEGVLVCNALVRVHLR